LLYIIDVVRFQYTGLLMPICLSSLQAVTVADLHHGVNITDAQRSAQQHQVKLR